MKMKGLAVGYAERHDAKEEADGVTQARWEILGVYIKYSMMTLANYSCCPEMRSLPILRAQTSGRYGHKRFLSKILCACSVLT